MSKQTEETKVTPWGNTFANGIGAGFVAGIVAIFGGIQWGVGVLVFFSVLVFPGLVKPFNRKLVTLGVALVVAVVVKYLIEFLMEGAFG